MLQKLINLWCMMIVYLDSHSPPTVALRARARAGSVTGRARPLYQLIKVGITHVPKLNPKRLYIQTDSNYRLHQIYPKNTNKLQTVWSHSSGWNGCICLNSCLSVWRIWNNSMNGRWKLWFLFYQVKMSFKLGSMQHLQVESCYQYTMHMLCHHSNVFHRRQCKRR